MNFICKAIFSFLINIYCYIDNLFNQIFIFKSVYILDNKLNKKNKTLSFYISYFTNFKINNKKYYKVCITDRKGLCKVFTALDYKNVLSDYKHSKICLLNKRFIKFKINDIDCTNNIKNYYFYDNSILDYYLFNHSVLNTIDNPYDVLRYLDNMTAEYKIMNISKHSITENKINDMTTIINKLE